MPLADASRLLISVPRNADHPSKLKGSPMTYPRISLFLQTLFALAFLSLTVISGATDFYISPNGDDSNPGTQALPWRTLVFAGSMVRAGDRALIADGNYAGGITVGGIINPNSGTSDAHIVWQAINPGGPVIWGDQSLDVDAFRVFHSNYVDIDGLTIRNAARDGLRVDVSNHVTVRHCVFINNQQQGILAGIADDLTIEYNECAYSIVEHGIYLSNGGDRAIVRYNVCHDNTKSGIQFNGSGKSVNPTYGTSSDGIMQDNIVTNNVCYNNGLDNQAAAINLMSVRTSLIANNLMYNNGAGGISMGNDNLASATQWGCKDNRILFNTIYFRANEGRWCIQAEKGSTNNTVMNNIMVGGFRGAYLVDGSSSIISDYNLIPTTSPLGVASFSDTNTYFTLAQWQAFSGNDLHSVMVDPAFANNLTEPFDFHLRGWSPAIGFGVPVSDVPTDLDGTLRPAGVAPDVGCYVAGAVSTYTISGHVTSLGRGIAEVEVSAGGFNTTTASDGFYEITDLAAGTYSVTARHPAYIIAAVATVTVGPSTSNVDFTAAGIIGSLSVNPTPIVSGTVATGTVTTGVAAPPGGTVIQLSSTSPAAPLPVSVTIPEGAKTVSFPFTVGWVNVSTQVTLIATLGLNSVSTSMTIQPTSVFSVAISPASVIGGTAVTATVRLTGPAAPDGATVAMSSDNTAAMPPATVTVPAGAREVSFPVQTGALPVDKTVNVRALLGGATASAPLKIIAPLLQDVWMTPGWVFGGDVTECVVYLTGPAPAGGTVVKLSKNSTIGLVTMPATITVPAGASDASVALVTSPVLVDTLITVKAAIGNRSFKDTVIVAAPTMDDFFVDPLIVNAGSTTTGTIVLSSPAPTRGVTVTLTSGDTGLATVPAKVVVPAGATTATFAVVARKSTYVAALVPVQVAIMATYQKISHVATITVQ